MYVGLLILFLIILSNVFVFVAYNTPEKLSSVERYKDLIENCIPSSDKPADPTIFINNGTHTFQLQTCRWNGTNGINMSEILWDNLRNTFNNE